MALVSVDGGNGYWHPRPDDNPFAMLVDELLPLLPAVALGWSMGGYGALLLARESEAGRLGGRVLRAAAAGSPALFPSSSAGHGAFDGTVDYTRWGDLARHPGVRATPLHISCGRDDVFRAQAERYRSHVRSSPVGPAGVRGEGRHNDGYWRSLAAGQLAFLAKRLT